MSWIIRERIKTTTVNNILSFLKSLELQHTPGKAAKHWGGGGGGAVEGAEMAPL